MNVMVVRGSAAPSTSWSKSLTHPKIDETAYVHSFSTVAGDVHIGANVLVAPGTSIRADEGGPFHIGEGSSIQDGVVIHSLEQGRILGDDQNHYSVWIGKNTLITHLALIHGPAYVGENCFIGFRSTVFNARVGKGSIVMMHTLIQDVEIPPGRFVPSGSVITTQQQADRLPSVGSIDTQFARHIINISDAARLGYVSANGAASAADNVVSINSVRSKSDKANQDFSSHRSSQDTNQMPNSYLDSEVVSQVRHLLSNGYRIGTEHADTRRFQTSSWQSCTPISATRDSDVFANLENCLSEHSGEYVRLFGIDTRSKRRVSEIIIQRPSDQRNGRSHVSNSSHASTFESSRSSASSPSSYSSSSSHGSTQFSTDVVDQVRQLLREGYRIGTEHADARRFQTSSWQSCTPISATRDSEVLSALESCMAEHRGEYVRLFGIDTKSKCRVGEAIIQRPAGRSNGAQPSVSQSPARQSSTNYTSDSRPSQSSSGRLSADIIDQVRQLLRQGYQVGSEHANKRRFQTSSWHTCSGISSTNESEVLSALEACIAEHKGEYVRIYGIDTQSKRRVGETIIQRP